MSSREQSTRERVVKAQIEIDAPADAVWRALTDAQELTRWFPLKARVEPGAGGSIWLSWEDLYEGESRIRIWEPNSHLRTGYLPGEATGEAAPEAAGEGGRPGALELLVDYFIESKGNRSVLRVVHSGFGREGEWDDEYEGVRRGWAYELRSLRHYLERHRGSDRRVAWALKPLKMEDQRAWDLLLSPQGLLAEGGIEGLEEDANYSIHTPGGLRLEGTVWINQPPLDFSGTVSNLNDALFRIGIESGHGARSLLLWLAAYDVPKDEMARATDEFEGILASVTSNQ